MKPEHTWCFSWGLSKKCAPFSGLKAPEEQEVCCWQSQAGVSMGDALARAVFPSVPLDKNWWRCCCVVSRGSQSHLPWLALVLCRGCRPPFLRDFYIYIYIFTYIYIYLFVFFTSEWPFLSSAKLLCNKGKPWQILGSPVRGTQQNHPLISWG